MIMSEYANRGAGAMSAYNLRNYMEDVVGRLADKYMAEAGACRCEKCRLDVMALALNELPPSYVVTPRGEIFAAIDASYLQKQVDAEVAVLNAVRMVKASPKHENGK
jgi:competence protein ComFB